MSVVGLNRTVNEKVGVTTDVSILAVVGLEHKELRSFQGSLPVITPYNSRSWVLEDSVLFPLL